MIWVMGNEYPFILYSAWYVGRTDYRLKDLNP